MRYRLAYPIGRSIPKPSDPPDLIPGRPWFDGNNRPPYKAKDDTFTLDQIEDEADKGDEVDYNLVNPDYMRHI
jgi:hypothetical protein